MQKALVILTKAFACGQGVAYVELLGGLWGVLKSFKLEWGFLCLIL